MSINELTEKNLHDAVELISSSVRDYIDCVNAEDYTEQSIIAALNEGRDNDDFSYIVVERGTAVGMFTVSKRNAEILNFHLKHEKLGENFGEKFLGFVIKQFSGISRVTVWVCSLDYATIEMIEAYGFEYTGEQDYVSKERNIMRFKYMFKRKK